MENKIISIKINLGGRSYPMKIKLKDEVVIRKSAKIINEQIAIYKQQDYQSIDNYDCLAMTSLHFVTKMLRQEKTLDISPVFEEIDELNHQLKFFLKKHE